VDPELRVHDITHNIPKFQPWAASQVLAYAASCWPAGTVFVSVVDPGVGTSRRSVAALTKSGQFVITPDNGTLTHIAQTPGLGAVRQIDEAVNRRPGTEMFHTFHGRDVYAYTAARLAAGIIDFAGVGPEFPVDEVVRFHVPSPVVEKGAARGVVVSANTHFGTVVTNVSAAGFDAAGFTLGCRVAVEITHGGQAVCAGEMPYVRTFGEVAVGAPLVYTGSTGDIFVSCNQGSFLDKYGISGAGPDWQIQFRLR